MNKTKFDHVKDQRIIWLFNRYAIYYNAFLIGTKPEVEFKQNVESIEDECRAIWGSTDLFYQFLKERLIEGEPLTEENFK